MTGQPPRLVVLDCDGTLVDSERIGVQVGLAALADLGVTLTAEDYVHRFVGCSAEHWDREIARAAGGALPDGWARALESRRVHALATQLVPVEGAVALLDGLDRCGIPYRLASNSDQAHVVRCLRTVGLADRFAGRVHCAEDVPRGKPAPDVYLAAAYAQGVDPADCWAVEDSPFGLQAAVAAGMRAFAFRGGVHPAARLELAGAEPLHALPDLLDLLLPVGR